MTRKPKNQEPITEEVLNRLSELYKNGMSVAKIMVQERRSSQTVRKSLEKFGIKIRTFTEQMCLDNPDKYAFLDKNGIKVKTCVYCLETKSIEEFEFSPSTLDRLYTTCRNCKNKKRRDRYATEPEYRESRKSMVRNARKENPKRYREYELKKRFKMTLDDFDSLFASQGYKCAACGGTDSGETLPRTWHIDHDHSCCSSGRKTCGKCVRGILCRWCNMALGNAAEDPRRLRKLADYIEQNKRDIS